MRSDLTQGSSGGMVTRTMQSRKNVLLDEIIECPRLAVSGASCIVIIGRVS